MNITEHYYYYWVQRSRFYLTLASILYSALLDKAGSMVLSPYAKLRVIALHSEGFEALTIAKKLWEEAIDVTQVGVHKFLCVYKATHTINCSSGSWCPSRITAEIRKLLDQQMIKDDKMTAHQLH